MMLIEANGIQINYDLSGKKGGPVVMLSHSLGCNLHMWDPQIPVLEPQFQVLRYDTRGHGNSETPKGAYTLEQMVDDVLRLLDELGMGRVHFVGLSMGGMIGQGLALKYPGRLLSLALCDTASVIPVEAQPLWEERIGIVRDKGLQALLEATLERWFTPSYLSKNPPAVQNIRKQFLATPVAGYIGCSEAIRRLNYLDRLSEIKLPTLIMVGEEDPGTPVAASEAMHKRISNSKLVVLPSARHLSNIEQTGIFNKALVEFLKQF
jgi:3-oxoadipate enol-lactonase